MSTQTSKLDPGMITRKTYDDGRGTVKSTGVAGNFIDRSGTTSATPNTSTLLCAVNPVRNVFMLQNLDAAAAIWINFTSAATTGAGSIKIPAGTTYMFPPGFLTSEAINIVSGTASIAFTAKEG